MLLQILRHTPLWVGALLAVLIAAGASQLRTRRVPLWQPLLLPAVMFALGVSMLVPALRLHAWAAAPWAVALAGGALAGWQLGAPAQARWDAAARRLQLPGSIAPMALMLTIFGLRYGAGVFSALQPEAARQPLFVAALVAVSGLVSGFFAGRAAALVALPRRVATIAGDASSA